MTGEQILFGVLIWLTGSVPFAVLMGNIIGIGAEPEPAVSGRRNVACARPHDRCADGEHTHALVH